MGSNYLESDRIVWKNNTLNELKSLLGENIAIDFDEDEIFGRLDFPWPISVDSIETDTDDQGDTWISMVISFDAIDAATKYQVRFSPYSTQPYLYFTSDDQGGEYQAIFYLPAQSESTDVGFVVCLGDVDTIVGGYESWSLVYESLVGIESNEIDLWVGTGASVDTSISAQREDPFPVTDTGYGFFAFKGFSGTPYLKTVSSSTHSSISTPSTFTTPTVTAEAGDIIVAGARVRDAHPDSTSLYEFNGFTGVGVQDGITGIYANGVCSAAGIANGGDCSATFAADDSGVTTVIDFIAVFGIAE